MKTTIRYHYTTIEMTKIKNNDKTNCWQGGEETALSYTADGMQNGTAALKNILAVSLKNHAITHNPVFVILGIYPREMKTYVDTKIC